MQGDGVHSPFELGQRAWEGVHLSPESFARRASELQVSDDDLRTRASDLFLAWACAQGDPSAIAHFERVHLSQVDQHVRRFLIHDHIMDELRQELRIRLLLGSDPRIGRYAGRGSLGAWVRTAAIRLALDMKALARGDKGSADIDALSALVAPRTSPELSAIRTRYGPAFQEALEQTLSGLDSRSKTLLRMHFVDGLNIDAIGRVYRVHRATIARWLVGIRNQVMADLQQKLSLDLHSSSSEFRSMLAVVREDLDVSLRRLLSAS
jgi:RNA polymerase sigma-70 factor (ECF subfamily)